MRRRLRTDASRAAIAGALCTLAVGGLEVAIGAPAAAGSGGVALASFVAIGLSVTAAVAALVAGILAAAAVVARLSLWLVAGGERAAAWPGWFPDDRARGAAGPWLHAGATAAVLFVGASAATTAALVERFSAPMLIGLSAAIASVLWLGAAAAVGVVVFRAAQRAAAARPLWRSGVAAAVAWLAIGWLGLAALALLESPVLSVFPFRIGGALTFRFALSLTLLALALLAASYACPAWLDRLRARRRALAAVFALVAAVSIVTIGWLGKGDSGRRAVLRSPTLRVAVDVVLALTDVDRDGSSSVLGGGDCAPFDGSIHPGARDIAHDGIDSNCSGRDYQPVAAPSPTADAPLPPELAGRRYNVLLIVVDTLRADHVGAAGYGRDTTPNIDRLAARGARFERAYSASYRTSFSMPALFVSQFPQELGLGAETEGAGRPLPLPADAITAAEAFARADYSTGLVTCFFYFDGWRMDQGADFFRNVPHEVDPGQAAAPGVTDAALEFVRGQRPQRPWLLTVHYFDPHLPYAPATASFGDDSAARYDAEIRQVDDQIGRLLADVDLDNTIVAVTSDHGEGLGQDGVHGHTAGLHEFLIHVPLVIAVPGLPARVVGTPASAIDVAPTLAALAGVEPPPRWTGRAHVAAIAHGRDDLTHVVFATDPLRHRHAAITSAGKLSYDAAANLATFEARGSGEDSASLRERLEVALRDWRDRVSGEVPRP